MLTAHVIDRLVFAADTHRLIQSLADNGMICPLPLRARLAHPVTADALALRRLAQLTYGPTPTSHRLVASLLECQNTDGSYPGSADRDPLATAAVAAAFSALLGNRGQDDPAALAATRDRAIAALAGMQEADGLFGGPDDRTRQDRQLTSAFILFLLSHDDAFRAAVNFAGLLDYFDERRGRLEPETEDLVEMSRPPEAVEMERFNQRFAA